MFPVVVGEMHYFWVNLSEIDPQIDLYPTGAGVGVVGVDDWMMDLLYQTF